MIKTISRTQDTILIVDDTTGLHTARADHPKWADITKLFDRCGYDKDNDFTGPIEEMLSLMDLKTAVENYTVGRLSVSPSAVTYGGRPIHTVDAERVLSFMKEGLSYKPIANYIEKKMKNPSARAIAEMYNFLEHRGMPLTIRGTFLAYKGVTLDFWSIKGNTNTVIVNGRTDSQGKIHNAIGEVIEVERSSVDDNFHNDCSFGLHAGSLAYAKGWGHRVVIVEIDPADVVSVPADCNCQKLRCCKYTVIGEYAGPLPDTLCTDFETEDGSCHQCGADRESDCTCEETCDKCGNGESDCICYSDTDDACPKCKHHKYECMCPAPAVPPPNVTKDETPDESWIREKAAIEDKHIVTAGDMTPIPANGDTAPAKMNYIGPRSKESARDILGLNTKTFNEVRQVLVDVLGVEWKDVEPSTKMDSGFLNMDSLDQVELVMGLEDAFGIEISDEDAEKSKSATVADIVKYVETKVSDSVMPYAKGQIEGQKDRANGLGPKWLKGDEKGADSPDHADIIRGYVDGYN